MALTWGEIAIAVTVISGWLFSRVTTREFALERVIDERVTSESVECEPEQTDGVRTSRRQSSRWIAAAEGPPRLSGAASPELQSSRAQSSCVHTRPTQRLRQASRRESLPTPLSD